MLPSSTVPSPNSPNWFSPHFQTVPSDVSAIELLSPPQTETTLLNPATCTGVILLTVVPSPISPCKFSPHDQAVPSLLSRSEEHTSELQSHSFISYAVFCLKKRTYTLAG